MSDIEFYWNNSTPALSFVRLGIGAFKAIEILKRFAYDALVMSNRFKMVDRRGKEIIGRIFNALSETGGDRLLPEDVRKVLLASKNRTWQLRTICDFVASMTDRYCAEFYSRLTGNAPPSIYKPF
jgi:dGTPase